MIQNPQQIELDDDYQPTLDGNFDSSYDIEIKEYAQYLGMNPDADKDLLWIAEEGLKALVPEPWHPIANNLDQDEIKYFNTETGEIQSEHPLDEHYRHLYQIEKDKKIRGLSAPMPLDIQKNKKVDKIIDEQRVLIQQELIESLKQIDKNFELKKKEIMKQNDQEIDYEKQRWEQYKKAEEQKIKEESEKFIDVQLAQFKEKLHVDEERERTAIQKESDEAIRRVEREIQEKFEKEKQTLVESYANIRKTIQESEKERFDYEISKFRQDQGRSLDSKKGDIEKLKNEKRKVQGEYNEQLESLRRDFEKKFELEKKQLLEEHRQEIETFEREEEQRYDKKLEQAKRDMLNQGGLLSAEQEILQYRQKLEEERELDLREYRKQLDQQLSQEEERLERKRQKELKDYEQQFQEQEEQELKRKQQKQQVARESEERDLELMKLRIDQLYQDQLESFKKEQQLKFEKERRLREDERRKRMQDIQSNIDKLSIPSSDKDKLRREIDNLAKEQKELQSRIKQLEDEKEQEREKKRQLQRELNEINIQANAQKNAGLSGESREVTRLRDELTRKASEIDGAKRQYKDLLDSAVDFERRSPVKNLSSDNQSLKKLEDEMKQIKEILKQHSSGQGRGGNKFQQFLDDVEIEEKENSAQNGEDEVHLKDFIAKEKQQIKSINLQIEEDKNKYKREKKELEDMKYQDPTLYRQRSAVLEKVKTGLEKKIDKVNDRIAKIKDIEQKLRRQ